jgi:hypothetical protein
LDVRKKTEAENFRKQAVIFITTKKEEDFVKLVKVYESNFLKV